MLTLVMHAGRNACRMNLLLPTISKKGLQVPAVYVSMALGPNIVWKRVFVPVLYLCIVW